MGIMNNHRRRMIGLLAVLPLIFAGCGFQPLYGTKATRDQTTAELSRINISPIPDRIGQLVYNNLVDRMHTKGTNRSSRYHLKVSLSLSSEGIAVTSDDVVTRSNLTLTASFEIFETASQKVLFSGQTFAIAAYNVGDSEFANLSALRDARVRTAREVSEEIKNQVVYFVRTKGIR